MHGTIFYDPFAAPPPVPASDTRTPARKLTRPEPDEMALRAVSLLNVSRDLERLSRQRPQN